MNNNEFYLDEFGQINCKELQVTAIKMNQTQQNEESWRLVGDTF